MGCHTYKHRHKNYTEIDNEIKRQISRQTRERVLAAKMIRQRDILANRHEYLDRETDEWTDR